MKRLPLTLFALVTVLAAVLAWPVATAPAAHATTADPTPIAEQFGRRFATGMAFSCAIDRHDTLSCWGNNSFGSLGDGSFDSSPLPVAVDLGGRTPVAVAVGLFTACALLDDHQIMCWGTGPNGELGDGSTTMAQPTPVFVNLHGIVPVEIGVGIDFACALSADQAVYCWGNNANGQLGTGIDGLTLSGTAEPDTNLAVALSTGATALSVGMTHACVVLDNGNVACWGDNDLGQVAWNHPQSAQPTPIEISPASVCGAPSGPPMLGCAPVDPGATLSVSADHLATCALLVDHRAYCWGVNDHGQRTGTPDPSPGKSQIHLPDELVAAGRYILEIETGSSAVCALLDDASVSCWGDNSTEAGPVGLGISGDFNAPAALNLPGRVLAVDVNLRTACALYDTGVMQCWGHGLYGSLGTGDAENIGDDEPASTGGPVALATTLIEPRTLTASSVTQAEGDGPGSATVTVTLNDVVSWPEIVTYFGPNNSGTVTIPAGETSATFPVDYTGDTERSGQVRITLSVSAMPLPRTGGDVTVTIVDDEQFAYWLVNGAGAVYAFADAEAHGDATTTAGATVVDIEASGNGYWTLLSDGSVQAFGAAQAQSPVDKSTWVDGETAIRVVATSSGHGYWLITSKGRVHAVGDAVHYGDMASVALNAPIVDAVRTPAGSGYYLLGGDGGVFSFGDAAFYGSTGSLRLNAPVRAMAATPHGYWFAAADGGVFSYGDAEFHGSMGGIPLNQPVVAMVGVSGGYVLVAGDGGTFNFSDLPFLGSFAADPPASPIVAITA